MQYGIVYLLTNPYMPGLVKIGMDTTGSLLCHKDTLLGSIAKG